MPLLATQASQTSQFIEMMERLGIEPGGGAVPRLGLSYTTAFHRCKACDSKPACRAWMDTGPAVAALAPRFCPNADIFFELQVDRPGRHPGWPGHA
jgi:Family of unknown function (DUF6455)